MTTTLDHPRCRRSTPCCTPPASAAHPLDRSVWESLAGVHACFAERNGRAVRYQRDVAPFAALEDPADPRCWADAAELIGPGGRLMVTGVTRWPRGWVPDFTGEAVQLVAATVDARPDPEAVVLGRADVPEILALVERTAPGPFLPRTIELGTHLGIRRGGVLVAMAGERQHPPGWTEISGVCTDGAYRGQGLATRLIRALAACIRERGEAPFLHAPATSTNAIRSYEAIGFAVRRRSDFAVLSRL